jgi:4-hydroxy-tetrahydrodipicolinate synthase
MPEIGRLLTAMVTPLTPEGAVDYQQAKRLAVALLDSGSDGMVVSGTTGEAPTLTNEEKVRLFREIKAAVGERGAVVAGTGNYNTAESIELSREAEKAGVDGLLLTVPYYNKPPQEGLYRHFEAIAGATKLPCILYNIPGRSVVNMTAETTIRLSHIPNIVGVKEASGNFEQIAAIIDGAEEGFRVWSGNDGDTLHIMALGGYGVICVVSHLVGLQMKEMIAKVLAGEVEEAARIHLRLLPLMTSLMTLSANPIPIKTALNRVGFRVGSLRLPLCEPDQATQDKIAAEVARHKIDLPVAV